MKKGPNLSRNAYAKRRGCDEKAVRKALADGRIELEDDGKIDPEKADRMWAENSDPAQVAAQNESKKIQAATGSRKFNEARAKKEEYAALLKELEYETQLGRLVPIDHVRHVMTHQFTICKTRLLTIAVKLAPQLAAISDPVEAQALLRTEILDALNELVGIDGAAEPPIGNGGDVGSPEGGAKAATRTKRVKVGRSKQKTIG